MRWTRAMRIDSHWSNKPTQRLNRNALWRPVLGVWFLGLLTLGGCTGEQAGEPGSFPSAVSPSHAISAAGLKFNPPARWIPEMPDSSMRLAQYRVPSTTDNSGDAQLLIYYFAGQGGSTQANIDRWVAQFTGADGLPITDAQVAQREAEGLQLTLVDVTGTYQESQGPMMGETTPRPDYRMRAVVVEGTGGPWFVKLTGPEATVEASLEEFDEFLNALDLTTQ